MAQAARLLRDTCKAQPYKQRGWVTPDAVSNLANTSDAPGKMNDLLAWHECSAMLDGNRHHPRMRSASALSQVTFPDQVCA